MKVIEFKGLQLNILNDWNELTLKQFVNFLRISKWLEVYKKVDGDYNSTLKHTEKNAEFISLLTGLSEADIDKFTVLEFNEIADIIHTESKLLSEGVPDFKMSPTFTIDGVMYKTRSYKLMGDITVGESASINALINPNEDSFKVMCKQLAVLVRPCKELIDPETKEKYYEVEEFNKRDLANLEWRANLFYEKGLAKDLYESAGFFLNGVINS